MRTDYIEISPTPVDEPCAQVGQSGFREHATKEMNAFINQLYREFPDAVDKNVVFKKKWFSHDFGSYGTVVAEFFVDDDAAVDFALNVEMNTPYNWDEEAIKELTGEKE